MRGVESWELRRLISRSKSSQPHGEQSLHVHLQTSRGRCFKIRAEIEKDALAVLRGDHELRPGERVIETSTDPNDPTGRRLMLLRSTRLTISSSRVSYVIVIVPWRSTTGNPLMRFCSINRTASRIDASGLTDTTSRLMIE